MHKKKLAWSFLIIAVLGLAISLYLVHEHYDSGTGFCDMNAVISCTLVNQSSYSELFGIPVAFFGMFWFVGLAILTFYGQKEKHVEVPLLLWSIVGLLSVAYLMHAEYVLKAICLWCTSVHILVMITTILAICAYRKKGGETHA